MLPALRYAEIRLVATCDLDVARAERAAVRFGAPRWYTSAEEMLAAERLDALIVVGPPALHVSAALLGLSSGLDVFIEKPPGLCLADAERLRAAAVAAGRQLQVGFMKRHALAYTRVRDAIRGDDFGTPRLLRLNYSHWRCAPLREHLAFMSSHALDLARFLMGDVVGGTVSKTPIDDQHVIALLLDHRGGGTSMLSLSSLEPRVQERLEIAGDSTLITVDDLTEVRVHARAPQFTDALSTDSSVTLWRPDSTIPIEQSDSLALQGYAGEMAHFAAALRDGTAVTPSIDDGVAVMQLVEAVVAAPAGRSELVLDTATVIGRT